MARWLWALLLATCVLAEVQVEDRRSKLPYIADAVGNKIPPPSGGPAPVGSPSNLLTPDRYEFYTFDESGELVKRLMTLEEIQAIVAAGEGNDGHLVTFANDDQPNIAFNFSQAPFTKVHNVVTNVQNVLKAQMEAQKNNPPTLTTLDTPDVSDSWSLILPTIFGNTGDDITPEKSSNTHAVPETDTLEYEPTNDDTSLSKEGDNNLVSSSAATSKYESFELSTEKLQASSEVSSSPSTTTTAKTTTTTTTTTTARPRTTTTTTTTPKPRTTSTTTTTAKPKTTTTARPRTTSTTTTTTPKPRTTSSTTTTTTTAKPKTTSTTTTTTTTTTTKEAPTTTTTLKPTRKPIPSTTATQRTPSPTTVLTTSKPRISTTVKPVAQITLAPRPTTIKSTTNRFSITTPNEPDKFDKIDTFDPATAKRPSSTEKITTQEKLSSFVPVSTVAYVTSERTTLKSTQVPKTTASFASTTKRSVSSNKVSSTSFSTEPTPIITTYKPVQSTVYVTPVAQDIDRNENATTITTQSMSPSTDVSSTEFMSAEKETKPILSDLPLSINGMQETEPLSPIFDIAQSISQITSDLGNNYPIASNSNLIDTSKTGGMDLESKENIELDIPNESNINVTETKGTEIVPEIKDATENFVKISTIDPPVAAEKQNVQNKEKPMIGTENEEKEILTTLATEAPVTAGTTMDPILSESMGDLLSQIVNQNPQNIIQNSETTEKVKTMAAEKNATVTEKILEASVFTTKKEETTSSKFDETTTEKAKISEDTNKPSKFDKNSSTKAPVASNDETTKLNEAKQPENNFVKINTMNINNLSNTEPPKEDKPEKSSLNAPENDLVKDKVTSNQQKIPSEKNNPPVKDTKKPEKPIKDNKLSPGKVSEEHKPQNSVPSKVEKVPIQEVNLQNRINFESASEKDVGKPNKINKIHISDKLEVIEDKISDARPKIDEFKKKIQKVNIDDKELVNDRNSSWKLISTVIPPKSNEIPKDKLKGDNNYPADSEEYNKDIVLDVSKENQGLEVTTKDLGEDIAQFTELCNELAFRYWNSMTENIDKKRSFVLSPYSVTSMLAMMFMGARGATSGEMNEILKLDDMVTFNPHFTLKNISDSIETTPEAGVIVSAFIRELYSDRDKGKVLTFYKERAQHFYNGHVEEINFKFISDVVRRRTNLLVKRYSWGRISEYMKTNSITMQPPLAAFSANVFQTDCTGSSVEGRDGEMYFVVSPTVRQRRLVPVPAVVYKKGFLAGYDPVLDATAAALGSTNSIISTLFLMPGQQGNVVHAEDLEALERRLLDSNPTTPAWNRLLRTLLPRIGLELQIPRFSHKSIFNVSQTLKAMGLKDIFNENHADLGGLNGPSKDLYLSDMVQQTTFVTCGEDVIGEQHHIEEYPESLELTRRRRTSRWANGWDEPRDYQRAFHDPHDVGEAMHLPLHLRPRQARLPARNAQPARLKFDRPFLYFVRHNPSGMILYVGRYNPRLLP